jgi:hypothetical protein
MMLHWFDLCAACGHQWESHEDGHCGDSCKCPAFDEGDEVLEDVP